MSPHDWHPLRPTPSKLSTWESSRRSGLIASRIMDKILTDSANHRSGLALGLRSSGCATGFASAGAIVGFSGKSGSLDDELQAKGNQKSLAEPPGRGSLPVRKMFWNRRSRGARRSAASSSRPWRPPVESSPGSTATASLIREDPRQSAADFLASQGNEPRIRAEERGSSLQPTAIPGRSEKVLTEHPTC